MKNLRTGILELNKEAWIEALNRRLVPALIYFGSELVFCLVLALISSEAAFSFYWTAWQGESSYYWWHGFFGLHPLKGYLFVVLAVSTIRLTAMWFIFFKGDGPLLELPSVRRVFNPERFPRLWMQAQRERSRRFLFSMGLIPAVWWIGFLALRQNGTKWGVAAVIFGNAVKLTSFAFVFYLGRGHSAAYLVIGVIAAAALLPRLVEKLISASRIAHRPH